MEALFLEGSVTAGSGHNAGQNGQALGLDIFLMSGCTIHFNPSPTLTITDLQSDNNAGGGGTGGGIEVQSGNLILAGTSSYTGTTTVDLGAILTGTTSSLIGNITDNGSVVFNQASTGTFAGAISGSGTLIKQNTGTVILTGANTYNGDTTVSAGTLQAGAPNTFSSTSLVTVSTGATLALNNSNQTIGNLTGTGNVTLGTATLTLGDSITQTFSGIISGVGGSLTKQGAGTFTLIGPNTYSGGTTVSAGTLGVSGTSPVGTGAVSMANGTTLQAAGNASFFKQYFNDNRCNLRHRGQQPNHRRCSFRCRGNFDQNRYRNSHPNQHKYLFRRNNCKRRHFSDLDQCEYRGEPICVDSQRRNYSASQRL